MSGFALVALVAAVLLVFQERATIGLAAFFRRFESGTVLMVAGIVMSATVAGIAVVGPGTLVAAVLLAVAFVVALRRFVVNLALWFSSSCGSTLQATVALVISLLVLCAISGIIADADTMPLESSSGAPGAVQPIPTLPVENLLLRMNPLACWEALTFFSTKNLESFLGLYRARVPRRLLATLVTTICLYLLSSLLWLDACRRFEREGRG